jgi:hypothetical protein
MGARVRVGEGASASLAEPLIPSRNYPYLEPKIEILRFAQDDRQAKA